ncbi:hypothetical protein BDR04DRAFT_1006988 [Suillus decipiens]|nr:hypothetical protein BDR04DRAFT_1006988 [Suillus decipiens]
MLDNPNEAIFPDFMTIKYAMARARLIVRGVTNEEAAAEAIWTFNNDTAKDAWAEQVEVELRQAQEAWRVAAEQEQEQQQVLDDKLMAVRKEEHKKNKAKFIPVSTVKILTIPVIIPSHYAVCKLKTGDYCELYYFTNKGLSKAKKNLLLTELQGLILIPGMDGQQMWVNMDETRNSKTVITKDENLSWEEFNEAALCMIMAMKQQEWPEDRINMHISF